MGETKRFVNKLYLHASEARSETKDQSKSLHSVLKRIKEYTQNESNNRPKR